jgi:hypothetical protein
MIGKYLSSTRYRAAQFAVGMTDADAGTLCLELNRGRDFAKNDMVSYNGLTLFVIKSPGAGPTLTVEPGNWIIHMPDGSLDVHADADFCSNFCPATS